MIRKCPECDTLILRPNKVYCSPGHKQQAYRLRKREKTVTNS